MIKYILIGVLILLLIVIAALIIMLVGKNNNSYTKNVKSFYNDGVNTDNGMYMKEGSGLVDNDTIKTVMIESNRIGSQVNIRNVQTGYDYGHIYVNGDITIGSESGNAIIKIPGDKTVSGVHCKLVNENDNLYIYDLGSKNGTYINDVKVLNAYRIDDNVNVRLGRTILNIEVCKGR